MKDKPVGKVGAKVALPILAHVVGVIVFAILIGIEVAANP